MPPGDITVSDLTWNAPAQISYPGGTLRTLTYDGLLRPTRIQVQGAAPSPLMDYRYTYDAESNILQKATEHGNYRYGYDLLYRLTQADNPSPLSNEAYTYDPLGNRLTDSRTNGLLSTNTWTYNGNNQLLQHFNQQGQPVSNRYDENGSLVQKISASGDTKDNQQFAYDAQNRLSEVKDKDGNPVASYQYDPFGHRIKKAVYRDPANHPLAQPNTVWFIYAEEGLVAEADASGNITGEYGWQPDGTWGTNPVFLRTTRAGATSPETFYYQNDHLGTPQQLLDSTGAVVWQAKATSFGETQVLAGNQVENNLRFPGQYGDAETGMHQNWFRDYLSAGGRYGESDPIGSRGGVNTYNYGGGNPVGVSDPMGLAPYDHDAWTRAQGGWVNSNTNCYGYALDRATKDNPSGSTLFPRPTCENLMSNAKKDGLVDPDQSGQCGGTCPNGYHKVQIFLDDSNLIDRDYHVYRQDDDGGWSHKMGRGGAPDRNDASGRILVCPANSNRDFKPRNYAKYCGTLCAPESGLTQKLRTWSKK